jgi:hypothetical protein
MLLVLVFCCKVTFFLLNTTSAVVLFAHPFAGDGLQESGLFSEGHEKFLTADNLFLRIAGKCLISPMGRENNKESTLKA